MKKQNSLKAAFIYTMIAFVSMVFGVSLVSCDRDDVTGHDNNGNAVMSVKAEKRDTTPEPVFRNDTVPAFRNDSVIVTIDYYKNDTIIDVKNYGVPVMASISREFDKLQTTEARLANLDFTFGEVSSSTNGKNQVVGKQDIQDGDGQNYNGQTTSGKIFDIYAELVSFKKTNLKNTELEPGKDEAKLVNTNIAWVPVVRIVNAPNLEGKTFELTSKSTEHLRYILKNAPEFVKYGDWKVWKETGNWNTVWHFECNEYWSNDSVAPKSKLATLKGSYSKIELSDKVVSNLVDYTHPVGTLVWGNWYGVDSRDSGVTLFEKKGTKKSPATNGFDADKFNTEFTVTMQKADVLFCDSLFHVESDEATLTNQRNIFVDEDSDRDGYSMVRFTDSEVAKWAGEYDQKLDETCKLYLKLAVPEVIGMDWTKNVERTKGGVTVTTTATPKYDNGTNGSTVTFVLDENETWTCLDSVIYENVTFVMEETGSMEKVGEVSKTKQTKTVNEGTYTYYRYAQKYRQPVKVDGTTKYQNWEAIWFDDFSFEYMGYNAGEYDKVKTTAAKVSDDKLNKDESRSDATKETWIYSVLGTFTIDNIERTDNGYGRITKALEEEVVTEYWDRFNFEADAKEYEDRVEYFLRWIKEYSTGKKTSTDVKLILKRSSEGSNYTLTVEDIERVIGSQSEETSLVANSESTNDIVVSYDWLTSKFELPNVFDGKTTKNDVATFVDPTNVKVSKKNSKGEEVTIELPSFEHQLSSTVSDLEKISETEDLVKYTYTRTWSWASSQCTSTAKSYGNINKVPEYGGGEPDYDFVVGKIFATVSRPSNRNAVPITAYTYLLVSEDGTKCLPLGFYKGAVTKGQVTDMHESYNSACYVKNANEVVPTHAYSHEGLGMMIWADKQGTPVDSETHTWLQGNGFNDSGNDWINHTGMYAPKVEKVGNLVKVTFEGTKASYTFRGWDVK